MKTFIFAFSLISSLSYAQIRTASTTVGSGSTMTIDVTINDFTGTTQFEVSGPSSKWFAAAFNTTNMNGYAIVHNNNGGNPLEYVMSGTSAPTLQTNQDLGSISSSTSGTTKTFNYSRDNNTGNTNDYTFTTATTSLSIAYAIGSGPNLTYHGPNRGSSTLTFTNPCDPTVANTLPVLSVCAGETVEVFGNQVSVGTYSDTVWSSIGCDSVVNTQVVDLMPYNEITIDTMLCQESIFDFMGTEITTGGEYKDTTDCDITTLNINFQNFEANASFSAGGFMTDLPFHTTYWFSCDGDTVITGETGTNFIPQEPGSYAVISSIDINGICTDTSDCVTVTAEDLKVNEIHPQDINLVINNKVVSFTHNFQSKVFISALNTLGQEIVQPTQSTTISLKEFPNSIYFIKIESEGKTGLFKISL